MRKRGDRQLQQIMNAIASPVSYVTSVQKTDLSWEQDSTLPGNSAFYIGATMTQGLD
jgi:hypothetical protein